MYMDTLKGIQRARIHTIIGLNDHQLFVKLILINSNIHTRTTLVPSVYQIVKARAPKLFLEDN